MEQIIKVVSNHQPIDSVTIRGFHHLLYDQRPDSQLTYSFSNSYDLEFPSSSPTEIFQKSKQELKSLNLKINATQSLKGKKMSIYSDLHQLNSQQKITLQHQQNQVLLVDIWATWCGPCQKPMQHNQQMLQKNQQKWKNKVRIVAVSVDEQKDTIKQRVDSKGWNKIQHLTLLGWNNQHPLIKQFQVQGIPFVFLVNKSGQIDFVGHPMSINLQQRINELLEAEVKGGEQKKEVSTKLNETVVGQTKAFDVLTDKLSKDLLKQKFGKFDLFSLKGDGKTTFQNGKYVSSPFTLKLSVYQDSIEAIQSFKDYLKDIDSQIYKLQENIVKFVVPPEIQNSQCADCKAKLQYPAYWCKWDPNPNTFRCRSCVQKKPAQQGKHYSYLQNSVLLTAPFKRISLKNLGNNIQPESIDQVEEPFAFGCNGCGSCPQKVGQARYISLGCRSDPNYRGDYVDICQGCFIKYFEGDNQVKQRLENDGHKQNHPFLRILYNVAGYYNF